MIYLLTAVVLSPGAVVQYTFTHKQYTEQHKLQENNTNNSSSRFVVEGVFRQSGVVRPFKVVDPVLFIFVSHVLYSSS